MTSHYPSPALDAEIAYRREQLASAARRTGRGRWFTYRRRNQF